MTTYWTSPTTVVQYAQAEAEGKHIGWNIVSTRNPIVTVTPLLHISCQPKNDITMKTYFLNFSGYVFENLPETVSGINLKLNMNRGGRIADETVQLTYQGKLIGNNLGLPVQDRHTLMSTLHPITTYGGDVAEWGIKGGVTLDMIQDPSFGVVLRFRSHPDWPHSTTPKIFSTELQIY